MRRSRLLSHFVIVFGLLAMGCTAAQKSSFTKAMNGSPSGVAPAPGDTPTPGSIEGETATAANVMGTISTATMGTPISGYTQLITAGLVGLLALERVLVNAGVSLPNSKRSQLASNSASAGGTNSNTGQPSNSSGLKAA